MGRVFKFHNDVDTDQIIASQYLLLPNIEEMKVYTFESIDKDFAKKVKEGDIVAVKVKNTSQTLSQQFKNFFYTVIGNDTYTIAADHGGIVTATGKE